jgi:hypothetical protein
MTATLVNKGQSVDKTTEAFQRLRDAGICPMPMMMHHDSQPLYSPGSNYGLLNQIKLLRKAGAVSLQVLMMTPSPGTKLFGQTFTSGMVIDQVGDKHVDPHMHDGNYVVASTHQRPWRKQLNLLLGYFYFYNIFWLAMAVWRRKTRVSMRPAYMQIAGILGLMPTACRTSIWAVRLMFGKIARLSQPPASRIPMRSVEGGAASHSGCETPVPIRRGRGVALPIAG